MVPFAKGDLQQQGEKHQSARQQKCHPHSIEMASALALAISFARRHRQRSPP